jgi:hypothetical protein
MSDESPTRRPTRGVVLVVGSTIVLLLAVGLFFAAGRERVVPLGRPHRFDDFAFGVVNVHRLDAIEGLKPERGLWLVVRLGIRNQAKQVDYQFRPETAWVEDAQGHRYSVAAEATRKRQESPGALGACDKPIPAGSSCTTDLVFDVPADVWMPRLMMSSGAIGDALDRILEGKVRFALDEEGK